MWALDFHKFQISHGIKCGLSPRHLEHPSSRQSAKEGRPRAEYQLIAQAELPGPDDPLEVALGALGADLVTRLGLGLGLG